MPPACPPAPSWTHPSAVSGWLGEAAWVQLAGPTAPRGVLRGAVAPRWPRAEGWQAAVSPRPREGSRVLFILPETSLECLLGNKGSWGFPPQAGGLAPGSPVEGLPVGGGPPPPRAVGLHWGGPRRLLPEVQRRSRPARGLGESLGTRVLPRELGQARPREGVGLDGVKGCLPPGQGLAFPPRPAVGLGCPASSHVGWVGGQPPGWAQEWVGMRRPCPRESWCLET